MYFTYWYNKFVKKAFIMTSILQELQIALNLAKIVKDKQIAGFKKKVDVYTHCNEHIVIPRFSNGVYGSSMKTLRLDDKTSFNGRFYVRKNRVKVINRSGQKCIKDGTQEPIGRCIVNNLEETVNCTSFHITANKSREFCNETGGHMVRMNEAKLDYLRLSEADLVNQTGCLPSCDRYETEMESTVAYTWPGGKNPTMKLFFEFEGGSYDVREEYIVYDTSNFIADVGGYLGLLMGHSILSIYYLSTGWLSKMRIWRYVYA